MTTKIVPITQFKFSKEALKNVKLFTQKELELADQWFNDMFQGVPEKSDVNNFFIKEPEFILIGNNDFEISQEDAKKELDNRRKQMENK